MKHTMCLYWHIIMVINMKLLAHKIHYQIFLSITSNRRCVMVSYNFLVIWEFPFCFLVYAAVPNSCNWLLITDMIISWSRFSCIGFKAWYQLFWFDYIKRDIGIFTLGWKQIVLFYPICNNWLQLCHHIIRMYLQCICVMHAKHENAEFTYIIIFHHIRYKLLLNLSTWLFNYLFKPNSSHYHIELCNNLKIWQIEIAQTLNKDRIKLRKKNICFQWRCQLNFLQNTQNIISKDIWYEMPV